MSSEKTVAVELTAEELDDLSSAPPGQWRQTVFQKIDAAKAELSEQTRAERFMLPWNPLNAHEDCQTLMLNAEGIALQCYSPAVRRLIAAAPEMAEMLERSQRSQRGMCGSEWDNEVLALLRKAGWID